MASHRVLTFYEHEKKLLTELAKFGFSQRDIDRVRKLNRFFIRNRPKSASNDSPEETDLDEDNGFLTIYGSGLKAKQYVGFATLGNFTIQVLPKVFGPSGKEKADTNSALLAFLRMLNVAYGLKIRERDIARLGKGNVPHNLFEIFVYLFARTLWEEVQRGYYREYIETQNEAQFLRGKLLLTKQVRKPPYKQHRFSVELHEFSEDNLINQIFYTAVMSSLDKTSWRTNKKLLGELMLVFSDVSARRVTPADFDRVHFTRLNERFRRAFNLAKIILFSLGSLRQEEAVGFFIDMNDLFERFILWELRKNLVGYEVRYQESRVFLTSEKLRSLTQEPDFVVYKDGSPIAILDAKYRELWNGKQPKKSGRRKSISANVARQMYVYSKLFGEGSKIPVIVILPKSENYNSNIVQPIKGTFFDERELVILTYNLDKLKQGQRDDVFSENIRRYLSV